MTDRQVPSWPEVMSELACAEGEVEGTSRRARIQGLALPQLWPHIAPPTLRPPARRTSLPWPRQVTSS